MLLQHYYIKSKQAEQVYEATEQDLANMTHAKPKIEEKRPHRRHARSGAHARKEFVLMVVGLETHTFNISNAKYAVKYQKSVDAIANHIQKEYKGGPEIAKAVHAELSVVH